MIKAQIILPISVPAPVPPVFAPPGSASGSVIYFYVSGFLHQQSEVKKKLYFYGFFL
jgi:hypothetical protein